MSATLDERPVDGATAARTRRSPWGVVGAIARVEGRRLLRHPATLFGFVVSSALAVTWFWQHVPVLQRDAVVLAAMTLPVAAGVLVAAHLAASRLRRDEVLPVTSIAPSEAWPRPLGLVVASAWPAIAAVLWSALALAVAGVTGGIGRPAVGDVLAPFATVLLGGTIGIAVGRWLPWGSAGIFALPVVAAGLVTAVGMATVRGSTAMRLMPWSDWYSIEGLFEVWPRSPWLHLGYVVLVAGGFAAAALLRDHRGVLVGSAMLACLAGAGVAGAHLLAVWDDPGRVATLVRDVVEPDHRLVCATEQRVEVCVPPAYHALVPTLRTHTLDALAVLPTDEVPDELRIELRAQTPFALLASLPDAVARDLPAELRGPTDPPSVVDLLPEREPGVVGASAMRFRGRAGDGQRLDLALGVVGQATGIPAPDARERFERSMQGPPWMEGCAAMPSPAEVVTFALAAASHPSARDALAGELEARPYGLTSFAGGFGFDDWFSLQGGAVTRNTTGGSVEYAGVAGAWSRAGATLGLEVVDAVTVDLLSERWDRWTDAAADLDDLLDSVGIDPLPTPSEQAMEVGISDELDERSDSPCP